MSAGAKIAQFDELKKLIPPDSLSVTEFIALAESTPVEPVPPGHSLFSDESQDEFAYLLRGELVLTDEGGKQTVVKAGTDRAKRPFSSFSQLARAARARSAVTVIRLTRDQIDSMRVDGDSTDIRVRDIDESLDETHDWMTKIVGSSAFRQLPPAKIHALILRLKEVSVRAGQAVARQGEAGDSYYVILRGECEVVRENSNGAKVTLARLGSGQAFGEESLLMDVPRNASVVMVTDGVLMTLPRGDFDELVRDALVYEVSPEDTVERVDNHGAVVLDVRGFDEHKRDGIPGSVNVPLMLLRLKQKNLQEDTDYICVCDNERQSVAAAFLLSAWGYSAFVLRGGVEGFNSSGAKLAET